MIPLPKRPRWDMTGTAACRAEHQWRALWRSVSIYGPAGTCRSDFGAPRDRAGELLAAIRQAQNGTGAHEAEVIELGIVTAAALYDSRPPCLLQWHSCVRLCLTVFQDSRSDGSVRCAVAESMAVVGDAVAACSALSDVNNTVLRAAVDELIFRIENDCDGDVRAKSASALCALLTVHSPVDLLVSALRTLTSRMRQGKSIEPCSTARCIVLKSMGKVGDKLWRILGTSPAPETVAPLSDGAEAVVKQLSIEESADWREAVPSVLSKLQTSITVAENLVLLLDHSHQGVANTAAVSIQRLLQASSNPEEFADEASTCTRSSCSATVMKCLLEKIQAPRAICGWTWPVESSAHLARAILKVIETALNDSESNNECVDQTSLPNYAAMGRLAVACLDYLVYGGSELESVQRVKMDQVVDSLRSTATYAVGRVGHKLLSLCSVNSNQTKRAILMSFVEKLQIMASNDTDYKCQDQKSLHQVAALEAVGRIGPLGWKYFTEVALQALQSSVDPRVQWTAIIAIGELYRSPAQYTADAALFREQTEALRRKVVPALSTAIENGGDIPEVMLAAQNILETLSKTALRRDSQNLDGVPQSDVESDDFDTTDDETGEDSENCDEDEDVGVLRRVASAHSKIRPAPPERLSQALPQQNNSLHPDAVASSLCVPARDPAVTAKLAAQVQQVLRQSKSLTRIDTRITSKSDFEAYHRTTPQVLVGIADKWKATTHWASTEKLISRWGSQTRFRVGDDENNEPVRMRLGDYVRYAVLDGPNGAPAEANPLYLFDTHHLERNASAIKTGLFNNDQDSQRVQLSDYSPAPEYFANDDLFDEIPPEQRPPHRWVLVGCEGSGSAIHKDPLHSSAWNTSLLGRKRWVLFPPHTPRYHVLPRREEALYPTRLKGPSAWFYTVYPRCRSNDWPTCRPIEVVQLPGETIYVPAGWWHVVMNLDPFCVAVTENFGAPQDFARIRSAISSKRKDIDINAWEAACLARWGRKLVTG